jgi:peptidoglycan/LPS O-acetylase OafA/YrhL
MHARINNFDSLRFWAALAVLWSHAFSLSARVQHGAEPLATFSRGQTTLGTVAVAVFFVISGYLITESYERRRDPWRFVKARALRIMPGLSVVLVLTTFLLGPLVTQLSAGSYLGSPRIYEYLGSNLLLLGKSDRLPGVFEDNALPWVNGSLWTLRYEVECYAVVCILGALGWLRRSVTLSLFIALIAYLIAFDDHLGAASRASPRAHLFALFLAGAVMHHWRPVMNGWVAAACALATILAMHFGGLWLARVIALPYAILWLALASPARLPRLPLPGDLSYGTYIYAWPVEQTLLIDRPDASGMSIAILATPIVLMLAFCSWHGVEKHALARKSSRRGFEPGNYSPGASSALRR